MRFPPLPPAEASTRFSDPTWMHQRAGGNNRKAKKQTHKKSNTKTKEHGAKSTQSDTI